jgi:hypothetical protein
VRRDVINWAGLMTERKQYSDPAIPFPGISLEGNENICSHKIL